MVTYRCNVRSIVFVGSIFRVVAFPKPLQDKMTALLHAHGYTTHPKQYTNELHVTVQSSISPYFHFGVVTRESASSATTGTDAASSTSTSVAADAPCRAYFKMEESLRYVKLQPGDRVIDVGASPVRGVFVVVCDQCQCGFSLTDLGVFMECRADGPSASFTMVLT